VAKLKHQASEVTFQGHNEDDKKNTCTCFPRPLKVESVPIYSLSFWMPLLQAKAPLLCNFLQSMPDSKPKQKKINFFAMNGADSQRQNPRKPFNFRDVLPVQVQSVHHSLQHQDQRHVSEGCAQLQRPRILQHMPIQQIHHPFVCKEPL
jgi:hypothetical protein